jgi:hypothetical protein
MAVSTQRREPTQQEPEEPVGILEHFGEEDASPPARRGRPRGASADSVALAGQVKDLSDKLARMETERFALLAQSPQQVTVQQVPAQPALDTSDLPDPVTAPAEFQKELSARVNKLVAATVASTAAQQTGAQQTQNRVDALWEDFSKAHPDLAENQDLVEFAATKVAQRAQARGIDVNKYMFTTRDAFFGDVVKEIDTLRPAAVQGTRVAPADQAASDEGTRDAPAARTAAADEPAFDRTGGIFGGQEAGGRPAVRDAKATDMLEDLKELQRSSGYF